MTYYCHGIPRLQLFIDSPNKLAALTVLFLPLMVALSVLLWRRKRWASRVIAMLVALFTLAGMVCLVLTYSRGGYVAFAVGLLVLAVSGFRRLSMSVGAMFIALLSFVPNAATRAMEMDAVKDMSIANRIILWRSICRMCLDNPLLGVRRSVGDVYMAWIQPLERTQRYSTAVSDYLTIGARYGMVSLALWLFIVFFVSSGLLSAARKKRSVAMAALAAGIVSYSVAAVFSTFYATPLLIVCFMALLLVGMAVVLKDETRDICCHMVKSMFFPVAISIAILVIGAFSSTDDRLRYSYFRLNGIDAVIVNSGVEKVQGVIVYLFDAEEGLLESEGRKSVRHLVRDGYPVIAVGVTPDREGLECARRFVHDIRMRNGDDVSLSLVGQNCGGRFAFLLGLEIDGIKKVSTIGAYATWPMAELSPSDCKTAKNRPKVWLVNGGADWHTGASNVEALEEVCDRLGIPFRKSIIENVGNNLGDSRRFMMERISSWIAENE